jgi:hypothetical protein
MKQLIILNTAIIALLLCGQMHQKRTDGTSSPRINQQPSLCLPVGGTRSIPDDTDNKPLPSQRAGEQVVAFPMEQKRRLYLFSD